MRLRRLLPLLAAAFVLLAPPARADIVITIDKSAQQMIVTVDGDPRYIWPVSTGMSGYDTPSGEFKPFRMERTHFSSEWDDAPMPHSIFFTQGGHAIHGSNYVKAIGAPASHGCVRLEPGNAAILFTLVRQHKMANTRVALSGKAPGVSAVAARGSRGNQRSASNDDVDFTGALPSRKQREAQQGWRDSPGEQRLYYSRERPYYAPHRTYRSGGFPFGW
ncbi:MAG: L,D-transpeptidase [Pseudolabrys sp.]|nr:L,D-transpeptidase [Pseudolabrys sp.]MSP31541.1 L,D-transpeptidase [Pseudolabrys sp.]